MVKVQYIGDVSPMRIKVKEHTFDNWNHGEIKEISQECADILIKQKIFKASADKKETVTKTVVK